MSIRTRKRDRAKVEALRIRILQVFPNCDRALKIAKEAYHRKDMGIARNRRFMNDKDIHFLINAYVRHTFTDYERLLASGMNRQEARTIVKQQIYLKIKEWGKGDGEEEQ